MHKLTYCWGRRPQLIWQLAKAWKQWTPSSRITSNPMPRLIIGWTKGWRSSGRPSPRHHDCTLYPDRLSVSITRWTRISTVPVAIMATKQDQHLQWNTRAVSVCMDNQRSMPMRHQSTSQTFSVRQRWRRAKRLGHDSDHRRQDRRAAGNPGCSVMNSSRQLQLSDYRLWRTSITRHTLSQRERR